MKQTKQSKQYPDGFAYVVVDTLTKMPAAVYQHANDAYDTARILNSGRPNPVDNAARYVVRYRYLT